MTEREFAIDVVKRLQEAGHQALWAGGCVRDEILQLLPKDYDVASSAKPEEVRQLFRRTVAVGMSFGVVEVIGPRVNGQHLIVQVATFRSDVGYSDGRRPDAVVFCSPQEDALRRDFTVNGMFFDPIKGELIDYVGGREDLQNHILRAIGDPFQRFAEDKLRLLRAVRIATRFGLEIEPQTAAAIGQMADQIVVVSAERIADELRKLLVERQRVRGVNLLYELGLIQPILPELLPLRASSDSVRAATVRERSSQVSPPLPHGRGSDEEKDLWSHTEKVLNLLGEGPSFPLSLAGLLHEIGRPLVAEAAGLRQAGVPPSGDSSIALPPEGGTPTAAELAAGVMAASIADRLRLSNAEKEQTVWLIENQHALDDAPHLRLSRLKKILAHPQIRDLLQLYRAILAACGIAPRDVEYCDELLSKWTEQDLSPPTLLTGNDLKDAGLKPGPRYKELLDAVRDAQLDGSITSREEALVLVKKLLADRNP